jgi:hypothetical protein
MVTCIVDRQRSVAECVARMKGSQRAVALGGSLRMMGATDRELGRRAASASGESQGGWQRMASCCYGKGRRGCGQEEELNVHPPCPFQGRPGGPVAGFRREKGSAETDERGTAARQVERLNKAPVAPFHTPIPHALTQACEG